MAAFEEEAYRIDEFDAVIERDAHIRLAEFLATPEHSLHSAGERLANSYQGLPDALQVLLNWSITFTNDPDVFLRQATEAALVEMEPRLIPQINQALTTADFSLPGIDAINASSTWRSFFTAMSRRHPTSVLSQALERQQQLSSARVNKAAFSSPQTFCDEFEHLLINSLSPQGSYTTTSSNTNASADFMSRFSALCTYDECTTKSALFVLDRLSHSAHQPLTRSTTRRLAQNIRKEAIKKILSMGRAPPTGSALASRPLTIDEPNIHIARQSILTLSVAYDCTMRPLVVDALVTVAISRADVGDFRIVVNIDKEISMVTNTYAIIPIGSVKSAGLALGQEDALPSSPRLDPVTINEKFVLIRSICDELILGPLFQAGFSVNRRSSPDDALSPNKKRAICLLLAFSLVFHKVDDAGLLKRLQGISQKAELACHWCGEVGSQFHRIDLLVSTCETLKPGCATYQIKEEIETLMNASKDAFLARGLLIWATEGLLGGSNLRDLRKTAVIHLAFLAIIAEKHTSLRDGVVDALRQAMLRDYGDLEDMEIAEIKKDVMDCMSGLVRRGLGLPLVKLFLIHLAPSADAVDVAHLRSFLLDLLAISKPPFSDEFVGHVRKFIRCDRLQMAMTNSLRQAVDRFDVQCLEIL